MHASVLSDVRPCGPACRQTTPLAVSYLPTAGHPVHTSITVLFSFCHCPAPAPAPACRLRATSRHSSRGAATPPPMAPVNGCIPRPTLPSLSDPAPLPRVHRSPTVDTTANDHNISKPTHEREALVPLSPARSDGWVLPPARSCRSGHKPVSTEPAGSL